MTNHLLEDSLFTKEQVDIAGRQSILVQNLLGLIPSHVADDSGLNTGVFTCFVTFLLKFPDSILNLFILSRVADIFLHLFHDFIVL